MVRPALKIHNRDARRLWLHVQGLSPTPTGKVSVLDIVRGLGLLQIDTIRVVARAHHHILWSRNQNYREPMLHQALAERRELFEHFTHDASLLPMEMYPMWRRQFRQMERKVRGWEWHRGMLDAKGRNAIKERIREEGPLSTRDFTARFGKKKGVWQRPPHKLALDYMWYAGELATSHRINFAKYYDLTERVVPEPLRSQRFSDEEQINWLCHAALDRLGTATPGEIQRFWDAVSNAEARRWTEAQKELVPVQIQCADNAWHRALARADIETLLAKLPAPTSRLRILNPFDPVIRDRKRLLRLFGFDYKIEIFVPAAKRKWGYYVYPILEGDRMIGRIEIVGNRNAGSLTVKKLWPETGVRWTAARERKLASEVRRMGRFIGVEV